MIKNPKKQNIDFAEIRKRRRKRRRMVKIALYFIFFTLISAGAIWLFVFSPVFKFDNVKIVIDDGALKNKIASQLEAIISRSFPRRIFGNRNFLAWPNEFSPKDLAALPEISSLNIEKKYRENTIVITAAERPAKGIWCFQKQTPPACFKFDEKGVIFRESFAAGGNLIKVVKDFYQPRLAIGDSILPEKFKANILSILDVLEKSGLSTKEIMLKDLTLEEVEVPLSSGPVLYFSLRRKADIYLEVLKSLSQEPGFNNYAYVDLRVENRVYYR